MQQYVGIVRNKQNRRMYYKWCISSFICILFIIMIVIISYESINKHLLELRSIFLIHVKTNTPDIELHIKELESQYIWAIDPYKVREEILNSKMFQTVEVKISLPNILYISTKKRKPQAVWWNYKNFFLIDEEGVILNSVVTEKEKKEYMLIVGLDAVNHFGKIMQIITHTKYNGKVSSMRFIGNRRWDVILNNNTILKLPEKLELQAIFLFESLLKTKPHLVRDGDIIDMRLAPEKVFIKNNIYINVKS